MQRREFIQLAAAFPFLQRINSVVDGVRLGAITYSFRDLPRTPGAPDAVDVMVKALTETGIGEIELFGPHIEPVFGTFGMRGAEAQRAREQLRQWRLSTPMQFFSNVRKRFDDAGITLYAYTQNYRNDYTDEELDKTFEQAKALGVNIIASSTQLTVAKRLVPFAEKHRINVAVHGHSNLTDPEEFASPESFSKAMAMSKYMRINLDIGHFTAANFDAVQFIRENPDSITHLHIKDRKKNQGANVAWGEGDTPIKQVLALLKERKSPIRAFVEYEHKGTGTSIEEVKKCMTYMRQALA